MSSGHMHACLVLPQTRHHGILCIYCFFLLKSLPTLSAWLAVLTLDLPLNVPCVWPRIAAAVTPGVSSPCPVEHKVSWNTGLCVGPWRQRLFSLLLSLEYWAFRTLSAMWWNTTHVKEADKILASSVCVFVTWKSFRTAFLHSLPHGAWFFSRVLHGLSHLVFQVPFLEVMYLTSYFLSECRWDSLASLSYYLNLPTYSVFLPWNNYE